MRRDRRIMCLGLLPSIVFLAVFLIYPFLWVVRLSLFQFNYASPRGPVFVGWLNFIKVVRDPVSFVALKNTMVFTIVATAGQFLIGLPVALLLNRPLRFRGVILGILLTPIAMAPAAVGLIWRYMYNSEFGLVTYLMGRLGLGHIDVLGDPATALAGVILVDIWHWTPFIVLVLLAGLSSLPVEPFEAATVDGASPLQTFRHVTLPLLRPTIRVAILIRALDAIKVFDELFVMTEGGPGYCTESVSLYSYRVSFRYFEMGYGCAQIIVLLGLLVVVYSLLFGTIHRRTAPA